MHPLQQREAATLRDPELLDIKAVCAFFGGLDPSTIYRNIRRGTIPAPVRVTANTSRWLHSECAAALAEMIASRRPGQ